MGGDPDTSERDPIDLLVERFLAQRRMQPSLSVDAFASQHPEHATALRDLLPTIVALESHKRDRAASSSGSRRGRASVPQLERLGEFRIVREVGRGGMGVVFEAMQESLGRKVALKVLPQAALLTGNQLERFRREAQIAAQLHHSHIVPVFGSGESDGYHWYAMQFIDGSSLDRWREQQAAAAPVGSGAWRNRARFVARLGVQAASALQYAHGLGTLHRDIKPGNLLLDHSDHLWVTDFGLAKALEADGLTHSGDLLGTLQYMAPEQFAGDYDARSEVYALGITLYELLTLRPAFAGGSRSELMERIRSGRPDGLRRVCPEVPEDLAVVVEKAIARDAADRYASAAALQQDLQAFLDDRPIAARRLSTVGVVWRWCRRNRGMAALAASTALALVGAGVTGWVAYGITDDALGRAAQETAEKEQTLRSTLEAFGGIFDTLLGPDPALAFDEDEETGEQTVVLRPVAAKDVAVLDKMLAFYSQFAAQNAGNQAVQLETARAYRRVGAIHVRLGTQQNLEQAEKAFREAIERLAAITDRDTRRERAGALVELSQVQRWRRLDTHAASLQQALVLLEALPAEGKGVRLERARVHHLLAGEPPARRFGGQGRGPGAELERDRARAQEHVRRALELVDSVLAEDRDHLEARALRARCLRTSRMTMGREQRDERAAAQAEALTILREIVAKHPGRADDRFELCRALLEPTRSGDATALRREAITHADRLLVEQPKAAEYQALRAQAGFALAESLVDQARSTAAAERAPLLAEAERELRAVAGTEVEPPRRRGPERPPASPLLARRLLVTVYELGGRQAEAVREANALLDLLEQGLAERSGVMRLLELSGRPGPGEAAGREWLPRLAQRLGDGELQARTKALIDRLPSRENGPPPEPRRGR